LGKKSPKAETTREIAGGQGAEKRKKLHMEVPKHVPVVVMPPAPAAQKPRRGPPEANSAGSFCSVAAFVVNSEPHTGACPSVRLCVGLVTRNYFFAGALYRGIRTSQDRAQVGFVRPCLARAGMANSVPSHHYSPHRFLQNHNDQSLIPVITPLSTTALGDEAAPPSTIPQSQSSVRPVQ
jgi:hypothetical protein